MRYISGALIICYRVNHYLNKLKALWEPVTFSTVRCFFWKRRALKFQKLKREEEKSGLPYLLYFDKEIDS